MSNSPKDYWDNRYIQHQTGWDIGYVSTPLKAYFDQLKNKNQRILIPGAGNSYETEYLHQNGFANVYVVDIAPTPINEFKKRVPDFPKEHLILGDFFELPQKNHFDLIIEQTFFCAIPPSFRRAYAEKCHTLLNNNGKISGLLFNDTLNSDRPPYGGNKKEYLNYFEDLYEIKNLDTAYNSIPSRQGRELFIIFQKDEL